VLPCKLLQLKVPFINRGTLVPGCVDAQGYLKRLDEPGSLGGSKKPKDAPISSCLSSQHVRVTIFSFPARTKNVIFLKGSHL
jgi:hypothetical protein